MNLTLRPEVRQFIDDEVKSGRFPSPEAVIEAAIAELQTVVGIDDAAADAINEAEEQADRGEGMELGAFRAHMNRRIAGS